MRVSSQFSLLLALTLTALGAEPTRAADSVLRVGTSGDYAPFSFHDTAGHLTGFDITVAHRFAADTGREVVFIPFRWPDLVQDVRAGRFDIVMSGTTVRADRTLYIAFSRPYAVTTAVAVIAREQQRFRQLSDLDRPGVRVVVNAGGHLEQVARESFPHARIIPVTDNASLPKWILRGDADAAVAEAFEARAWLTAKLTVVGRFGRDRKAYALPAGAADLLPRLNEWLAAREADGWLNEQRRRWLGDEAALTEQQAAFEALVAAMDLRLQLMPLVAAVKRREHLPIDDPAQETRVLARVRTAAVGAGLDGDDVAAVFRVQMEAAKARERSAAPRPIGPEESLEQLRTAIAALSDQVIAELARCRPWLSDARWREQLDVAVRDGFTPPGMPQSFLTELLGALQRVRKAPEVQPRSGPLPFEKRVRVSDAEP